MKYRLDTLDRRKQYAERMEAAAQAGNQGAIIRLTWLAQIRKLYSESELKQRRLR